MRNPNGWAGDTNEILAGLHYKSKGYTICWPDVDVGYDFIASKGDENIKVQVKGNNGILGGLSYGRADESQAAKDERNRSRAEAALQPRAFDVLAVVVDPYIWLIPAIATHGKTLINVIAVESKYHAHREELAYGRRTPHEVSADQGRQIRSGEAAPDRT